MICVTWSVTWACQLLWYSNRKVWPLCGSHFSSHHSSHSGHNRIDFEISIFLFSKFWYLNKEGFSAVLKSCTTQVNAFAFFHKVDAGKKMSASKNAHGWFCCKTAEFCEDNIAVLLSSSQTYRWHLQNRKIHKTLIHLPKEKKFERLQHNLRQIYCK